CKAVGSQDTNWYLDDKDRSGIDDTVPKPKIKLFLVQEYVLILEKRELPEQRHRITDQKSHRDQAKNGQNAQKYELCGKPNTFIPHSATFFSAACCRRSG